jgi:type IV secretion system protein VirB1
VLLNYFLISSLLVAQCGAGVHPDTLNAIIKVESNYNALAINDNTTGICIKPTSKEQAVSLTNYLLSEGHSLDVGLMQINSQHFSEPGVDYMRLFDPDYNISTGSKILARFYREHAMENPNDKPEITLLKALSSYNTGSPYKGKNYVNKILKAAGASCRIPIVEQQPNIAVYRHAGNQNQGQNSGRTSIAFFKKQEAAGRE